MKYAVVILDGAAGYPLDCFGGKTSLEQAATPNLDKLAAAGMVGLSHNVPEGMEPSSNTACTSIMGYDPALYPIGRGAIEGASCGIELEPGQVALRLNLCNVDEAGCMHSYSCGDITTESGNAIIEELQALNDDTFTLHKSVSFRGILVVSGHPELMDTTYNAAHNFTDQPIADKWPSGPGSEILNDYMRRCNEVLATSKENARREEAGLLRATHVWAFWPGTRPEGMEAFSKIYGGTCASMLSPVDLLNGLAKMTDMKQYHFHGVTDGPDNDYRAMGVGALQMLDESDLAFIHVENPDAEGHNGDAAAKVAAIEAIDREIVSRLIDWKESHEEGLRIMALPDHPTPVVKKTHSSEPVPFIMEGPGIECSAGARLTENEAKLSNIEYAHGFELMKTLLA
jgi:2,3-bisphosphoglycerate-independent phosphoglycerate mutase